MNLSVSQRITLSSGLMIAFALCLMLAGLWGINSINSSVKSITDSALPLADNDNRLITSTLQLKIHLIDYLSAQKSADIETLEKSIEQQISQAETAQQALSQLTEFNKDLNRSAAAITADNNEIFSATRTLISNHKKMLVLSDTAKSLKRESLDHIDQIISQSDDLAKSNEGKGQVYLNTIVSELKNITSSINKVFDTNIPAAAKSIQSQINNRFTQLDSTVDGLKNTESSSTLGSFFSTYEKLKKSSLGEQGALNQFVIALQLKKQNQDDDAKLRDKTNAVIEKLTAFNSDIKQVGEDTKNHADQSVARSRTLLIMAGVIGLSLTIVIALFLIKSIHTPLNHIVSIVDRVASGDLTCRFDAHTRDEFGRLSNNMNQLVENLRNIITELNENSQQLSSTAQQTAMMSNSSFDNINNQRLQTDMIATAVEEMALTVDEVAKNAATTLREVENTYHKVTEGEQVVRKNIHNIALLAKDIETSADVIEKLNQRSSDIGSVLDVIRGVAEQTNLLALNAAIEAARAGEQGRGFAVVADEVRTLASRAHQSTAEIQQMIEQLQAGALHAVETMTQSRNQAQQHVESIASAGDVLSSIAASVTTIKDMSYQIATASEEQSGTTREQNKNILAIVDSAEKSFVSAKENLAASEHLSRMANHQLTMIKKFTI